MPTPRRHLRADGALREAFAAIRAEHAVPEAFPAAALAEAGDAARAPRTDAHTDLTDVPFVTIDPPGSMDLDQAMHLSRVPRGYRVRYAIADVAAFVGPGGALDGAVHERVLTVYCPDARVPLHPPALSEGAASLLPDEVRPAVVWDLELDSDGEVRRTAVSRALVRSRARLAYPQVQGMLDAGAGPDELPRLLAEIGTARARLERARGGVSLARPEQEVIEVPGGGWRLEFRGPLPVEDHNAQISLMTGMAAAGLMIGAGVGVLRTLPAASPDDVTRLRRRALALGVAWPRGRGYADVLTAVDASRPADAAFLAAATALFRGAAWAPFRGLPPADPVHGAIGAPYAHVTAPLRRLVDRYGLEISLAAAADREPPAWVTDRLESLGDVMAAGARRANAVDRACTDAVEAAVLGARIGEELGGVALDERTVQLADPAVVARTVDGDLPAGRRVRVRVEAADLTERSVTLRRVRRRGGEPRGGDRGARAPRIAHRRRSGRAAVIETASAGARPRSDWATVPNLISVLRLVLVPVFALLALGEHDAWALGVLVVAGASDWLDGRLARALQQQSRLGELLDPAADRLFILVTLLVLASRDVVPWWLVAVLVGRDVLLTAVLGVLMARRIGPLPVHFVGKAGTFALLYALPMLLLAHWPGWVGTAADVAGWAMAVWGIALYWLAAAVYVRQAATELRRGSRAT